MTEPIPKAYKPFIVASIAVLVLGLMMLAGTVTASFAFFSDKGTPLWVIVMGVFSVLGIVAGFGGLLGLMLLAGYMSWREGRRVQVISPEKPE